MDVGIGQFFRKLSPYACRSNGNFVMPVQGEKNLSLNVRQEISDYKVIWEALFAC